MRKLHSLDGPKNENESIIDSSDSAESLTINDLVSLLWFMDKCKSLEETINKDNEILGLLKKELQENLKDKDDKIVNQNALWFYSAYCNILIKYKSKQDYCKEVMN